MSDDLLSASTQDVVAQMFLEILQFDEFPAPSASERVLIVVVDDEELVRRFLMRMLRKYPCDVAGVAHGMELIKLLRDRTPDLVIMDVNMPHINGIDLCSAMNQNVRLREIPVVIFSGYVNALTTPQALACGARALFDKPRGADFVSAVWDILQAR